MTEQNKPRERIALLVPLLAGGGAERVMMNLARAMPAEGVDVDLVVLRAEGEFLDEASSLDGVRVMVLGCARSSTSVLALIRYLRRESPAAIISTLYTYTLSAIVAARLSGFRGAVVARMHNTISPDTDGGRSFWDRLILLGLRTFIPLADAVVAVSSGVAEDLPKSIGLDGRKVHVIYNPVVAPTLEKAAAADPEHPWLRDASGIPVIVGVGRLIQQKDFETLIRAFQIARRTRLCRLLILGEGPERARLEALVADLELKEDVDLPGFSENPFAIVARCSLFVLSSKWEGLPNALIEAFALGAPLVATDCPSGPREILEDGRYGLITPVGDVEAMADAMLRQLEGNFPMVDRAAAVEQYTFAAAAEAYLQVARASRPGRRQSPR